jgi:subtilisin family serine protease
MLARRFWVVGAGVSLILGSLMAPAVSAAPSAAGLEPHVAGEVIVGFAPGAASSARSAVRASVSARGSEPLSALATDAEVLRLGAGVSVTAAIESLRRNPNVRYAEPNYLLTKTATSNDPYFTTNQLWGMYGAGTSPANTFGSNAAGAWSAGFTGANNIYVMVIDEGIDVAHPDLAANIWTNQADPINGVDDDGNGYVDDTNGWDFVNNDRTVYDSGQDAHGTHVAGTIGGVGGNSRGVAGVNWNVKMISGKFLGPNGGTLTNAIRAVDYATDLKNRQGLNIVATNNSWGGGGFTQSLLDAINRGGDAGILFVAAAGNSGSNNDKRASYPSGYRCVTTAAGTARGWDCVVAVASINSAGAMSSFSSYGATSVDLGAPGEGIFSTTPNNNYSNYSGTSMATPHVSGAIALCAARAQNMTAQAIRSAVMSSATSTSSLVNRTVTGGRLNAGSLLNLCGPVAATPVSISSFSPSSGPVGTVVSISGANFSDVTSVKFNGTSATSYTVTASAISATVPAGATSGTISVTTSSNGSATSAGSFTVTVEDPVQDQPVEDVAPGTPAAPVVSNVTKNSAAASTTGSTGTVTGYEWRLYVTGTTPGAWSSVTSASVRFTGLRRETNYTVEVRAVNGTARSAASPIATFVTLR